MENNLFGEIHENRLIPKADLKKISEIIVFYSYVNSSFQVTISTSVMFTISTQETYTEGAGRNFLRSGFFFFFNRS